MANSIEMKRTCSKCKTEKSLENFYKKKRGKDGFASECAECIKARVRAWRDGPAHKADLSKKARSQESFDKARAAKILKNFGITFDEYKQMLKTQNNQCAICLKDIAKQKRAFAVDHCHSTGKIRALLCSFCNTALGLFQENIGILKRAIDYLDFHLEPTSKKRKLNRRPRVTLKT